MPGTQPVARAVGRVRRCRGGRLLMDEGISKIFMVDIRPAPYPKCCAATRRDALITDSTCDSSAYVARCRGLLI